MCTVQLPGVVTQLKLTNISYHYINITSVVISVTKKREGYIIQCIYIHICIIYMYIYICSRCNLYIEGSCVLLSNVVVCLHICIYLMMGAATYCRWMKVSNETYKN